MKIFQTKTDKLVKVNQTVKVVVKKKTKEDSKTDGAKTSNIKNRMNTWDARKKGGAQRRTRISVFMCVSVLSLLLS